jgi:glycosyltransferase involved in cell wall biosynthesis
VFTLPTLGVAGTIRYRLIWPALALAEQGHDIEIVDLARPTAIFDATIAEADVFVFQRVTNITLLNLVRGLRARGRTVVVDMDDDLTCISPNNPAWTMLHPARSPNNNWQHARDACDAASLVTVSTPELQRRYGMARSRVLRNCIPARFLTVPRPDVPPVWGWGGSLHSHPEDLPLVGSAVAELQRQGHQFLIVGRPDGTGKALGLPANPAATGHVEFEDWAAAIARLRVGVAPLGATRFNTAKSWLKPLEYAAVGVPWVGSDRAEYRALHQLGIGQVVGDRSRDWVRAVRRLMTDDNAWLDASEACRALAARMTIEEHAWRWLETWEVAWGVDHGYRPTGAVSAVR